jgi:hypothetical protein
LPFPLLLNSVGWSSPLDHKHLTLRRGKTVVAVAAALLLGRLVRLDRSRLMGLLLRVRPRWWWGCVMGDGSGDDAVTGRVGSRPILERSAGSKEFPTFS